MKTHFVKKSTTEELQSWKENLTAISLFSGCGGMALGFSQAGFNVRVAVEWDKMACKTLRANFTKAGREKYQKEMVERCLKEGNKKQAEKLGRKDQFLFDWYKKQSKQKGFREMAIMNVDITKTTTKEILDNAGLQVGEASALEGGFPCQGFSMAGARAIDDSRNKLYKECVRVIEEALPKTFCLENVPGIVSMADGEVMLQVVQDLVAVGYSVSWEILNAADYGVPQNRKRVLLFGERQDCARMREDGSMAYHIGFSPGTMTFPKWYFERYKKRNENVAALLNLEGLKSSEGPCGELITIPTYRKQKPTQRKLF